MTGFDESTDGIGYLNSDPTHGVREETGGVGRRARVCRSCTDERCARWMDRLTFWD